MRKDQIFVLLLVLLLPMTGCFGDVVGDAQADDDDDDSEPEWINDRGTGTMDWTLNLSENQWLEVKSAAGLLTTNANTSDQELEQYSLIVHEIDGWLVGSGQFSPIFGGDYELCGIQVEEFCFSSDPQGNWFISDWSIIYRIHSV
jgi:hypothetical protein